MKTPQCELRFMKRAIAEARKSRSEDDGVHPLVGAVAVLNGKAIAAAHRGELVPGEHAEFTLLERKLREKALAGATIYTTLEPCTTRRHPKVPCATRLAARKVARVVIGMLDPNPDITGKGQRQLRNANIVTELFPTELMAEVEELNRDFTRAYEEVQRCAGSQETRRVSRADRGRHRTRRAQGRRGGVLPGRLPTMSAPGGPSVDSLVVHARREKARRALSAALAPAAGVRVADVLRLAVNYLEADSGLLITPDDRMQATCLENWRLLPECVANVRDLIEDCDLSEAIWGGKSVSRNISAVSRLAANRPRPKYSIWLPLLLHGKSLGMVGAFRGRGGVLFERYFEEAWLDIGPLFAEFITASCQTEGVIVQEQDTQERELRRLLHTRGSMTVHFQPIVSSWTGNIAGHEALIRGPEGSSLASPSALFRVATASGDMQTLDLLCVERSLHAAHEAELSPRDLLFLNVQPSSLKSERLRELLRAAGGWLRPWNTVLELVELPADGRALFGDSSDLVQQGFSIASDDHGTGAATDHRLIELRPRFVKIAKEIVARVGSPGVDEMIRGFVRFASSYGGTVIAEGIETPAQLKSCREAGVCLFQGFGLARPAALPMTSLRLSHEMRSALS